MTLVEVRGYAPQRLSVGSVMPYVKKAEGESQRTYRQRDLLYALKNGRLFKGKDGRTAPGPVLTAHAQPPASSVLGPHVVLVPVPRSTVPTTWPPPAAEWGGLQLAEALCAAGFAARVHYGLRRVASVVRASSGGPAARPTVAAHAASLQADVAGLGPSDVVVLVDDIVTKGTQLAAAARVMSAGLPGLEIRGFTGSYSSFGDHDGNGENVLCTVTWQEGWDHANCHYPGLAAR